MTGFSNSPRIIKGGLVLIDPDSAQVRRVISLQYNPDTLTRTLRSQQMGEGADRSEALRLKGPALETIKLEAEIDAADQLEFPNQNTTAVEFGIAPQLAVLEAIVNPAAADDGCCVTDKAAIIDNQLPSVEDPPAPAAVVQDAGY